MNQASNENKWTGVEKVQGYGQTERVFKHVVKRDGYTDLPQNPFILAHPQTKGFDRFGLDCLAWMYRLGAINGESDQVAQSFISACEGIDNCNARCRIPYEELRMLSVLLVPALLWVGLYFLNIQKMIAPWLFMFALPLPLYIGWRIHRNLAQDLDDSLHPYTLQATTFLTRNGLTLDDIRRKPELISEGIRISNKIQELVKYQIKSKIINYRGLVSNKLPTYSYFQIPEFKGKVRSPYWSEWVTDYKSIYQAKARGHYFAPVATLAAIGGTAYAAMPEAIPDISYSAEIPVFEMPALPEVHIPYANGLDDIGLPQFNTNGNLMIENTGFDYQGNAYGTNNEY